MRSIFAEWIALGISIAALVLGARWLSNQLAFFSELLVIAAGACVLFIVQFLLVRRNASRQPEIAPSPQADTSEQLTPLHASQTPWVAPVDQGVTYAAKAAPTAPLPNATPTDHPPPEQAEPPEKMV